MDFISILSIFVLASSAATSQQLVMAAPTRESPQRLSADWLVLGGGPKRSVILKEGKRQPFVEIMPRIAFSVNSDVLSSSGQLVLAAGTTLLPASGRNDVQCEMKRRKGNERFVCLVDQDQDGRFESFFRTRINTELFLTGLIMMPPQRLKAPAVVSQLETPERYSIELFFFNRAEWVKRNVVQICILRSDLKSIWGPEVTRICLPRGIDLGDRDYPHTVSLYGGTFTFVSREGDSIAVDIEPPAENVIL